MYRARRLRPQISENNYTKKTGDRPGYRIAHRVPRHVLLLDFECTILLSCGATSDREFVLHTFVSAHTMTRWRATVTGHVWPPPAPQSHPSGP